MKIDASMLTTGPAPERMQDQQVNCVLGLWKPELLDDSNSYLPRWHVSNTLYYNLHLEDYLGYIELEDFWYTRTDA